MDEHFTSKLEGVKLDRPDGAERPLRPDLLTGKEAGRGYEATVWKAALEYPGFERLIPGFVFKRPNFGDAVPEVQIEASVRKSLEMWGALQDVNARRAAALQPGFHLPSTVRGLERGRVSGLLMTDLSEDGKLRLFDTKNLYLIEGRLFSRVEWRKVRDAIEADAALARESTMMLGVEAAQPTPGYEKKLTSLDPWLIAVADDGSAKVYLADINNLARIFSEEEVRNNPARCEAICAEWELQVHRDLDKIEQTMFFTDDAAEDLKAFG